MESGSVMGSKVMIRDKPSREKLTKCQPRPEEIHPKERI
jgi:hypothetical protein